MSLREELKHYVYDDMRIDPDVRIDKIINKILDAAVDECYQWFKQAETEELSFDDLIARIEAINKLRQEK